MLERRSIPISEDFNNPQGRFRNVYAYDSEQRNSVLNQKHVDIRSFSQTSELIESKVVPGLSTYTFGEEWSIPDWEPRTNLIPNPVFLRDGGSVTGYSSSDTLTYELFFNQFPSAKVVTDGSADAEGIQLQPDVGIEGGETYTFVVAIRAPEGATMRLLLWNSDGTVGNTSQGFVGTNSIQWVTVQRTMPADASQADPRITTNGVQALTFNVLGYMLIKGTVTDPQNEFFPTSDSLASDKITWAGVEHASASTLKSPLELTVASQSDRQNWNGLTFDCAIGTNTTTSKLISPVAINPVSIDIETEFTDTDEILVTLPDFPLDDLDLTETYIDFTSDLAGSYDDAVSIRFNDFNIGLIDGDSELRFPRSELNALDLQNITGIRFRIEAINTCTFRVLAIRLIGSDWSYGALDIDTIRNSLVSTVSPNGAIDYPYDYNFPRLFKADEPSSEHDPRPIDSSLSIVFNTGLMINSNRFTIYFRELVEDFLTQLDLDNLEMNELNNHAQPDTGDGKWDPRLLETFDDETMADLEGDEMFDLERYPDYDLSSWFGVTLQWSDGTTDISALDSEGNGSVFSSVPALTPKTNYAFFIDIEDNSFRAKLYPIDAAGDVLINDLIYDTTTIIDDFAIPRRRGRIGWDASFNDGDVRIDEIRSRKLIFAEYRSLPLESFTPVEGASLSAEYSPDKNLFIGLSPLPGWFGGTVVPDKLKANSEESFKVTNDGNFAFRGIQSNLIEFDNFDDYRIEFDIYYPRAALDADNNVELYLIGDKLRAIKLNIGNIRPDTWHRVSLHPNEGRNSLTGQYRLAWVQPSTGQATTWWLDNIEVIQHSMRWLARAVDEGPWKDNFSQWTNFRDVVNQPRGGILLNERGTDFQIAGQALRQDVRLGKVKATPKYAELGRVVWGERESNINLAADRVTSASSESGSNTSDNAVDGSSSTRWESDTDNNEWLQIDLGETKLIQSVNIGWYDNFALDYDIAVSENGTDWVVAAQEEIVHPGWHHTQFHRSKYGRYVRINCGTRFDSGSGFSIFTIKVYGGLELPMANFTTTVDDATVSFDGSSSTDVDGSIISYVWSFGDGAQGYGKNTSHTYAETGKGYNVTLTVVDTTGLIDVHSEVVGV